MIKYIGLDNVKILNGGFKKWQEMEFPVEHSIDHCNAQEKGSISINIKSDMLADIKDVKKAIEDSDTQLIDSRSPERYKGLIEPIDKVAGRIPSSVNIFYQKAFKNNQIKEKSELISVFAGINSLNQPIFYCGSGVTAAINIVAADEIGIKSRLYAGSYSDYISYKDNKIEHDDMREEE
jgi:thiosulfate/3-mercaptopyruvate sulfurtransferase